MLYIMDCVRFTSVKETNNISVFSLYSSRFGPVLREKPAQRSVLLSFYKYQMRELERSSAHNSKTTLAYNLVFLDNKEKGVAPIRDQSNILFFQFAS